MKMASRMMHLITNFRDTSIILATPILCLPMIFATSEEFESQWRCAYAVLIMGIYWIFEVLPLAVTALIPLIAFPTLGIMKAENVAKSYLPDTGFLFIGGLMVAVAVEKSHLHTRIALYVLSIVGASPAKITLGFMSVTHFLSMWISNTATAALMVPIAISTITELINNGRKDPALAALAHAHKQSGRSQDGRRISMNADPTTMIRDDPKVRLNVGTPLYESESRRALVDCEELQKSEPGLSNLRERNEGVQTDDSPMGDYNEEAHAIRYPVACDLHQIEHDEVEVADGQRFKDLMDTMTPSEKKMAIGLLISVSTAANIGGASTITGTASNLVLMGQLEKLYPGADTGINFLSWLIFAGPMCVVCLLGSWFIIWLLFLRTAPRGSSLVSRKLQEKYQNLPRISFAEKGTMGCFLVLLVLWVMRDPKVVPGFGALFKKGYVTDATSAMFIVLVLFCLPEKWPNFKKSRRPADRHKGLLDWGSIQDNFPWSVVILLGGGFALAAGVKESHLSDEIGKVMHSLSDLPHFAAMAICVVIAVSLTNICSNTVVASIFIPIVAQLAASLNIHPIFFMAPVTIASSFAFLLPVATPPNAIVFGAGIVKVKDMAITGALCTVYCTIVNILNMWFVGIPIYGLDVFPEWATTNEEIASNATSLIIDVLTRREGSNDTIVSLIAP